MDRPLGIQEFEAPKISDNRHLKVANIFGSHLRYRTEILSKLNFFLFYMESNRRPSASSVVPQPTASVFTEICLPC
jgi:hypothetical protein